MRTGLGCLVAAALVCVLPELAFAHGGSYRGPGGGGGSPQVPPGTADPPTPSTRWETWWANNKEAFLRLGERMRQESGVVTPGSNDVPGADAPTPEEERRETDEQVREALVPLFVDLLADESFEVRTAAAIALGKTADARGSRPLRTAAVKDDHRDVRDSAVLGLGLCGQQADIPFLYEVLTEQENNARHRSFAAFALGLIGGEDAAAALLRFLDGRTGPDGTTLVYRENGELTASTFVALGLTGDERVLPVLREALESDRNDENVRAFVVLSLGRMADRESLARVGQVLRQEKDAGLRRSAAIALGRMATGDDMDAVDALFDALRSDIDPVTRQFAAMSLGGLATDPIRARLRGMLPKADRMDRPFLALALGMAKDMRSALALHAALERESDESTRASYCIALALMGDVDATPLIERQLAEKGRIWLQGYAALSLGMLGSTRSAPLLRERLADENDARLRANLAVALGLLHDRRARTYLVETLRGDGPLYDRGGAAMALGVLRMSRAVPDLLDVARDKKQMDLVRAFSVVALGLIADTSAVPKLARFAVDHNYTLTADPLNEVLTIL